MMIMNTLAIVKIQIEKLTIEKYYNSMEYKEPSPSSVPHATLVPRSFPLQRLFFGCSIVVQAFFLAIAVMFFGLAFYFKVKNHKLLIDYSNIQTPEKDKQNIICDVVANQDDDESQEYTNSIDHQDQQPKNSLESQLFGGVLRVYERRLVYSLTYTIPWVMCVNFFDADVMVVITSAVFIVLILLFNIRRMLPDWKISILVYFLPALASIFPYIGGSHTLYNWTKVEDPLNLGS